MSRHMTFEVAPTFWQLCVVVSRCFMIDQTCSGAQPLPTKKCVRSFEETTDLMR